MKNLLLFYKSSLFQTIFLGTAFFILVATFGGYGQSGKSQRDVLSFYQAEVERLLLPVNNPNQKSVVVAAFLVHPMADPDYSVCLKDSARHYFLELRLLDQNLWREVLTVFMQKRKLLVSLVQKSVYSKSVSKGFKKKIVKAFELINPGRKYPLSSQSVEIYDATTYEFRWVKKGKMKHIPINFTIREDCYESGLIRVLDQIFADIKNNSLKGTGYFDQFK
ncbi:MAG: hypothetical protein M0Q53_09055 [Prolixibacteraceae bacterium]|nr:hypothetical protein [Prolixibacteraceae bacterium]